MTKTIIAYVDAAGYLCDYRTGDTIRRATEEEALESSEAGDTGAIEVAL